MLGKNSKGQIILIGGLPASGKTTLALGLKQRLGEGATLIDSDAVWYNIFGTPLALPQVDLAVSWTFEQRAHWISSMVLSTATAAAHGKAAIVTHSFEKPRAWRTFCYLSKLLAVEMHPFWLVASKPTTQARALQRQAAWVSGNPESENLSIGNASTRDPIVLEKSIDARWLRIDADQSRDNVLEQVLRRLPSAGVFPISLGIPRPQSTPQLSLEQR